MSVRQWRLQTALGQVQWLLESGPSTFFTCVVWFLVIQGHLTLGSAVAFSMYFGMILPPFLSFAGIFQGLIAGLVPGERVLEFFARAKEAGRGLPRPRRPSTPLSVTFSEVSFSYDSGPNVLENTSFSIPAGSLTVVAGPSGEGKTTLLNLCCAMYAPAGGDIEIGEVSTASVDPRQVRSLVSVAPQEPVLLSGTVRENLLYGNSAAGQAEIIKAAGLACAHEFIQQLPDGYDTELESEHVSLSVGQKHRLTLARALVRQTGLLLLDEPFANVDSATEERLWENLARLKGRRTIIIATHRPPPKEYHEYTIAVKGRSAELFTEVGDPA